MAYPRFQLARGFKLARIASGDFTKTSSSFVDLSTAVDLTLAGQVGDVVEVGVSMAASNANNSATLCLDAVTRVSGAAVNFVSGGLLDGVSGWRQQAPTGGTLMGIIGSHPYTLVAGDLSAGTVTLRLQTRSNAAGVMTFYADGTSRAIVWWVKNLGPVDPN